MKVSQALRVFVAVAFLATAGCARHSPLSPSAVAHGASGSARLLAAGVAGTAIHLEGQVGPGALYAIDVPADWNGDLVLYSHGYSLPQQPVGLPTGLYPGLRDLLLARGDAVAASSFSENGWAVAEGARQMHQLGELFAGRVGAPTRTFLLGSSLGGLISADLLQTFPDQYAGALSLSGPLGGPGPEFNYIGDVRLLWDFLMPCKLPGTLSDVPALPFPQNDLLACIQANQATFGAVALTHRQGGFAVAGINGTEFATSVLTALGVQWYGFGDAFDRTHDHMLVDNHDAVYVGAGVPASVLQAINAGIPRYTATPDAIAYLQRYYTPTGILTRPLLTIHAERDPQVPAGHEDLLFARVQAAGYLDNLSQSHYSRYGHTEAFTAAEVATAFDALVSWVNSGVKPTSPVSLGP